MRSDVTFSDSYTLEVGGERVELAWHGPNHSPDNICIHFAGHITLMFTAPALPGMTVHVGPSHSHPKAPDTLAEARRPCSLCRAVLITEGTDAAERGRTAVH